MYGEAVAILKERSITSSLDVEIINNEGKLAIASDARHACRKNSYHSDVVALGYKTHRVVHYEHVTKRMEPSSQKHEAYGVRRMYESFRRRGIKVSIP